MVAYNKNQLHTTDGPRTRYKILLQGRFTGNHTLFKPLQRVWRYRRVRYHHQQVIEKGEDRNNFPVIIGGSSKDSNGTVDGTLEKGR
jgi:hypothetical protein